MVAHIMQLVAYKGFRLAGLVEKINIFDFSPSTCAKVLGGE